MVGFVIEKYPEQFISKNTSNAMNRKSMKITQTPNTNEAVYLWFYSLRSKGASYVRTYHSRKSRDFI